MTILMLYMTRRMEKERFLFIVNIYLNIKTLINIILACILANICMKLNSSFMFVRMIFISICFVMLSTIDSYLIFRKIKKIRQLDIANRKYLFDYVKNAILMIGVFLIVVQLKAVVKDADDIIFISISVLSLWLYQYAIPYIIKITNTPVNINLTGIKKELCKICDTRNEFQICAYDGKQTKSANAFVTGTCINRYIFISDFFIENATKEEVVAILCHEYGHIKNKDIEKRIIFINIAMVLFIAVTLGMDLLETGVVSGLILLGILAALGMLIYKKMQQKQELRADKYAVSVIDSKDIYISALNKLYEMNDMMKKRAKVFSALSTHPQLKNRINNLEERS